MSVERPRLCATAEHLCRREAQVQLISSVMASWMSVRAQEGWNADNFSQIVFSSVQTSDSNAPRFHTRWLRESCSPVMFGGLDEAGRSQRLRMEFGGAQRVYHLPAHPIGLCPTEPWLRIFPNSSGALIDAHFRQAWMPYFRRDGHPVVTVQAFFGFCW